MRYNIRTYGITAITLAIAIGATLLTYKRLVPMESRLKRTNISEENSEDSRL